MTQPEHGVLQIAKDASRGSAGGLDRVPVSSGDVIETQHPSVTDARIFWAVSVRTIRRHSAADLCLVAEAKEIGVEHNVSLTKRAFYAAREPGRSNSIRFCVGARSVALASDVQIDPPAVGLGRVLMSLAIRELRQLRPSAPVARFELARQDALTLDAQQGRHAFYAGHGFTLDYGDDPEGRVGFGFAPEVGQLNERTPTQWVAGHSAGELLIRLGEAHHTIRKLEESRMLFEQRWRAADAAASKLRGGRNLWAVTAAVLVIGALVLFVA